MTTLDQIETHEARIARLEAELSEVRARLLVAENRFVSVKEAAKAMNCSPGKIRDMCKRGELQHRRPGRNYAVCLPPGGTP